MGRPKSQNPRTEQIGFRVTPDVKLEFEAVARAQGKSVSEWVRQVSRDVAQDIIQSMGGIDRLVDVYGPEAKAEEAVEAERAKTAAFKARRSLTKNPLPVGGGQIR